jgi:hypothetical protein
MKGYGWKKNAKGMERLFVWMAEIEMISSKLSWKYEEKDKNAESDENKER